MSEEVTVKRKKLTLKKGSIRSVGAGVEKGSDAEGAEISGSSGHKVKNTAYHKPAAIMAILAALIFVALITFQILEWVYYQDPPSVWPAKLEAPTAP